MFLLNLPELGFAGTFGAAVCTKMLSDDCTLSAYYLKDYDTCVRGVFRAAKLGVLFGRFFLGPIFEESQKIVDLSLFSKFARSQLCGHFWSRGLHTNGVR